MDPNANEISDFVIIGAGIAGAYVAWRLATASSEVFHRLIPQQSGPPNIEIFEASNRIGGRLQTEKLPGLPLRAELGGMRYTPKQVLFRKLVEILRLRD